MKLPQVQILVLVARSLTEIIPGDDRSGERFPGAAQCDVGESVLSSMAEAAFNLLFLYKPLVLLDLFAFKIHSASKREVG